MRRLVVVLVLAVLAGCGGQGSGTTTSTTTSTTAPDPAASSCRELNSNIEARKQGEALSQVALSRDSRIVTAAREVERILQDRELDPNAIQPDLDLEYANALLELIRACKVAGYLP